MDLKKLSIEEELDDFDNKYSTFAVDEIHRIGTVFLEQAWYR